MSAPVTMSGAFADAGDAQPDQMERYRRALKSRWWVVAVVTVVAVVAALFVSSSSPKRYAATAKVIVTDAEPIDTVSGRSATRSTDPERELNTDINLVKVAAVGNAVRRALSLDLPVAQLLREVHVRLQGTSNVVEITVKDASPTRAAALANEFARQYGIFRKRSARADYLAAADAARRDLARLTAKERKSPHGKSLATRLGQLEIASSLQTGGVQRVEAAAPPGTPSSPRSKFAVVVGGIVGLFLGSLLALALHLADRRLLEEQDVEDALGLPVLGRIPLSAAPDAAGGYALRDAYATVGLNVRLRAGLGESYTVLVTSGRPGEGKTSVTLGLARSLAFGGQRTLAVEADLRRPGFLEQLKLQKVKSQSVGGLKSLVEDKRSLGDVVVEFDAALTRPAIGRMGDRPRFSVIPAGIATDDPWELLAGDRMEKALGDARNQFDVILVDTPALGTIGDALAFADRVDTCLLVVRLRVARKTDTRRALETLRSTGVDVAGVVIIGSKRARPYGVQPPAPREVRFLAEVRRLRPAQRETQPKQAGARPPA